MNRFVVIVAVTTVATFANGHVAITKTPNHLHPVHGLYVKPSVDGTTGDLYVAATEDSGAKTQWLTDQPIHFLPHQSQSALATGFKPEESNAQKRAVVSSPVQYAYALPATGNTETAAAAYPYALPGVSTTLPAQSETKTETPVAAAIPQYNPYQFFYPQMLSAYTNMMTILKDAGLNDETASSAVSQSPIWPQTYAYPYQYVMVDPSAWAQAQAQQTTAAQVTPSTPASPAANETEN